MLKVAFFLTGGFDRPGPSNHLMSALMVDVLRAGHAVYLVGVDSGGEDDAIPSTLREFPCFTFDLVKRKPVEKSHFVRRYLDQVILIFSARKFVRNFKDCDAVFSQSSFAAPFKLMLVKRFAKHVPAIYNVQDMFPGSSIASGVMKQHWMQKAFFAFQKIAYRLADHITVISEDMKEKVLEQGVPEDKISVIYNWYDDESVQEVSWENNRFAAKYQLEKNEFYVQYAGTVGYVFDYEELISVAIALKDYKDIHFQVVAHGSQLNAFKDAARRAGANNITFLPLQPQELVSDVYSACSVCLIPLKNGVIGNSVPSKAALLMACKRPVVNVVDEDSHYYKEFNDNRIGIAVGHDHTKELSEALLRLYFDPRLCQSMGRRAYDYGRSLYSRKINTHRYIELFNRLASQTRSVG